MNISLYIAKRYLRSKSNNNAINFITNIALVGVVLGAASLFIVLSGFAGLKDFTLQFSSIVDPDLKAEAAIGKSFILTNNDISKLNSLQDIACYTTVIEERVIISSKNKNTLATLKGVDKHFTKVVNTDSIIEYGTWIEQKSNQIVVGWGISNQLSLGVLDFTKPITIYVPKPGKGQITSTKNAFNAVKTINVGVFYINEKLNDEYIFAPIDLAKKLLKYSSNQISSIEFKLKNDSDQAAIKTKIQSILGDKVILKN